MIKNPPANAGDMGDTGLIPGLGRSAREEIGFPLRWSWASLVAQLAKNPHTMGETWVQSLSWEDSLEEEVATHSSILAWEIPLTEEPGGLQPMGSQSVRHDLAAKQV